MQIDDIGSFVKRWRVLEIFLRIWLYLSPILYSATLFEEKLPEGWAFIANLNPMVPILSIYRSAILDYPIEPNQLLFAALWAMFLAVYAITVFVRFEGKMARYL